MAPCANSPEPTDDGALHLLLGWSRHIDCRFEYINLTTLSA
jgi:hypothetical protein